MSWLIVGTVPQKDFPLICGQAVVKDRELIVNGALIPVGRGTPALIAAACITCNALKTEPPDTLLCGDIGDGDGSVNIYRHLVETKLIQKPYAGLLFHYLQPDVDWHNRILLAIEDLPVRPLLMADAGYMYVAKMSGYAASYDLFTPDPGELAFLADEKAPHPFYTRGFLLHDEQCAPELIQKAFRDNNAARHLLVKGKNDYIVTGGLIVDIVATPVVEVMEPIGGTGDSLAGVAAALIASGLSIAEACSQAARINRMMGQIAAPTPASAIRDLLDFLPQAIHSVLFDGSLASCDPSR
jgi:ADP-dependent NAD(P)H-hydrate dehydratase / NAD(P)H-hydrate epimerase